MNLKDFLKNMETLKLLNSSVCITQCYIINSIIFIYIFFHSINSILYIFICIYIFPHILMVLLKLVFCEFSS